MGRKAISVLMTVTVCVAIFIFAALFVVRPGSETGLFPTESKAQSALSTEEIDKRISEEVARQVNEKLNEITVDGLQFDVEAFKKSVYTEVSEAITNSELGMMEALESELKALEEKVGEEEVKAFSDSILAKVDTILKEREEALLAAFANADRAVLTKALDEMVTLEDDIYAYVDERLAAMDEAIKNFAPDYDLIAAKVAENLIAATESADGVTEYDKLVYNISSDVMEAIAGGEAKTYEGLESYRENTYDAIESIVREVLERLPEAYATIPVAVMSTDDGSSVAVIGGADGPTGIVVEETAAPAEETEPAVEEAPVEKAPLITRPSFSFDEKDSVVEDRAKAREDAINSIMDAIRRNNEK